MGTLDGRSAIVVGASSGLGYGTALRFAAEGADVVVAARRRELLEQLQADAVSRGFSGRIVPIACDVAVEADLDAVVAACLEHFGKIDILAAIAQGGLGKQTYLAETSTDDAINSYLTGPIYTMLLMQKCFPHMRDAGYGRIITCSSGSAVSATPGFTAYAMAKAAVMTLTRKAAQEWGQHGIVTNCVLPITESVHFDADPQSRAALEHLMQAIPVRRMGDPYEDAGPILAFLASEGAGYLNGAMVGVDGGMQVYA